MTNKLNIQWDTNFTLVPNELQHDTRLSYKARGLFVTIISVAETWDFTRAGLAAIARDGVESVNSGIRELEETGWLTWQQIRGENGRWDTQVDVQIPNVTDNNYLSRQEVSPHEVLPHGQKPHNKEQKDKELNNKSSCEEKTLFDQLWDTAVDIFGGAETKSQASLVAKCVRELVQAGATPEELRRRVRVFQRMYPQAKCTLKGLVNRWGEYASAASVSSVPDLFVAEESSGVKPLGLVQGLKESFFEKTSVELDKT